MFFGSIPALVTPFAAGRVNEAAFRELVEWQIAEGSDGLVPCGTTGEAATLTTEEHRQLIEITVEVARGRVPVIAGCGSNNTAHAVELTKSAKAAGADVVYKAGGAQGVAAMTYGTETIPRVEKIVGPVCWILERQQ